LGGFAEVDNNEVTVLVNAAERGDTIDKEKARTAFTEAEAKYNQSLQSDDRSARIQATQAFKRARARLQAAGGTV
jgi:F-type H+-transporting ATPase subunit epsilon